MKPRVVSDGPLAAAVLEFMNDQVELLPWQVALDGSSEPVDGIYTYGHVPVDGAMLDRLPGVKVISNYGVGVDHIRVADAVARNIPVGNTPSVLDGATADMGIALMLAAGRRMAEGERYARSPEFLVHDPGYMLGREVHSATLGIIGMGAIGRQVARRAKAFDMKVLYFNRRRREQVEQELGVEYRGFDALLGEADYVLLSCPLTAETRNLINAAAFDKMKPTATLVNIARGGVVDTDALYEALSTRKIYAAGLDVTEPEPLPRDHPLLKLDNVTIMPHLGSATVETRREMARLSVENLLRGLRGEPLLHEVR
ncbi:MAG: D-glycerate dehydrogenase [Acidobacteria bacterium]|nr:D-glycerate dehydrogenase [Acidobacteriota bacterium]